jgi:hypothetical protein
MQEILVSKLWRYLAENNPELLFSLGEDREVIRYLEEKVASVETLSASLQTQGKPNYIIEQICMEALTKDLRPSRFNYLKALLEEEFEADYGRLHQNGTLRYELINLISFCDPLFEALGFSEENENNQTLRYALIGMTEEYLISQTLG